MNIVSTFRPYFWVLTVAFIVMGAYLLADTANFFVASRLEESMTSPKANPAVSRDGNHNQSALTARDYGSIARRNIFDAGVPDPVPVKYLSLIHI